MKYSVVDSELVIATDQDEIIWAGFFQGHKAQEVLGIPGSTDCILLLDYMIRNDRYIENLLRSTAEREVVWSAKYPSSEHDVYVSAKWAQKILLANTWEGVLVKLDPETGKIIESEFVK